MIALPVNHDQSDAVRGPGEAKLIGYIDFIIRSFDRFNDRSHTQSRPSVSEIKTTAARCWPLFCEWFCGPAATGMEYDRVYGDNPSRADGTRFRRPCEVAEVVRYFITHRVNSNARVWLMPDSDTWLAARQHLSKWR